MKLKGIESHGTYEVTYFTKSFGIYDERGNRSYYEDSKGYWSKSEYDKKDNEIYYENSRGYWEKNEYEEKDNVIYFENNIGEIIDERVKELTIEEIEKLLGYKIKIKGK